MNPNDTILTPNKKYKRTCKWTEICIQRKNEKDTQTDTEYKTEIANIVRHSTNTNTVSHVPSSPQLNLDNEDNGCAESQISIGEEKRRDGTDFGPYKSNHSRKGTTLQWTVGGCCEKIQETLILHCWNCQTNL